MKFDVGENTVVVGKRITVTVLFGSVAKIGASIYPDYAVVAYESGTVLTFIVQLVLANYFSNTTK